MVLGVAKSCPPDLRTSCPEPHPVRAFPSINSLSSQCSSCVVVMVWCVVALLCVRAYSMCGGLLYGFSIGCRSGGC